MNNLANRAVAISLGALFLGVGLMGFGVTTRMPWFDVKGAPLLDLWTVNPMLNLLDIAAGLLLIFSGMSSLAAARTANTIVGIVYLVLGVVALFIANTTVNILALNRPDGTMMIVGSLILLATAIGADRKAAVTRTA